MFQIRINKDWSQFHLDRNKVYWNAIRLVSYRWVLGVTYYYHNYNLNSLKNNEADNVLCYKESFPFDFFSTELKNKNKKASYYCSYEHIQIFLSEVCWDFKISICDEDF